MSYKNLAILLTCLSWSGLMLGQSPVIIGDLDPGEEIRIEYTVKVLNLPFNTTIISNQGKIAGTIGGMTFMQNTDDPNTPTAGDPTNIVADPTPEFSYDDTNGDGTLDGSDPCSCMDEKNVASADGEFLFHDVLTLTTGITGEPWALSIADGNILDMNGDPMLIGTPFVEVPSGTGNYILEFYHKSAMPTSFSVSPDGGTINYDVESSNCIATRDCLVAVGIPSMGAWALFILGLILTNIGLVFVSKVEETSNLA